MSETNPPQPTPAAPVPASARVTKDRPAPRRGGSLAFAVLLGLVALGATGFVGWRVWQLEQRDSAGAQTIDTLRQQIGGLEQGLGTLRDERAALRQRLGDADAVNRSLREEVLGVAERTRNVEDAVANLSERTLTGHDSMLLDETESLLRMAKERYALFDDAAGALAAYELADRSLAAVGDTAFSGVRQSLNAEREALAAVKPPARAHDLDLLAGLRNQLVTLPLKPIDTLGAGATNDGFLSRAGHALAGVISIKRDDGAPIPAADGRIARELAILDLAHAQAAVLAYDDSGRLDALKRVDATLEQQFDGNDAGVRTARAQIAGMLAPSKGAVAPQLGAALNELRNIRSVHALKPATAPAAAASAPAPAQATP
jgi:uroporphyrin-3 C-methyltransferase